MTRLLISRISSFTLLASAFLFVAGPVQAHMKQRSEAVLKFYNQLTTDQQKIFDVQATHMHSKGMR